MNTTSKKDLAETPHDSDLARDIEQLSELATLVTSARDAMSDEIVTRLSRVFSEGISLLDRLTRNEGLMKLLEVLDRPESQHLLIGLSNAIGQMSRDIAVAPPARGGMGELLKIMREPGTQEGLRSISVLGKYWSASLRDLHRRGAR
jgi:uncharacterized protein YjgD (DUF1641 family)